MEGCSNLRDNSLLHEVKNGKGKVGFGFGIDFPIEECRFDARKERLRSLFDELLVDFMREKSITVCKCIRPLPALCGDGRAIDLFKLFWVVWRIGGYDPVSRNNFWSFVVEECGLSCRSIPSLKLIYIKYLNELDQWLRQVFIHRDLEGEENGVVHKLQLLSQELKTSFCLLSSDRQQHLQNSCLEDDAKKFVEKVIEKVPHKNYDDDEYKKFSAIDNNGILASAKNVVGKVIYNMQLLSCNITEDVGRLSAKNDKDAIVSAGSAIGTVFDSRKRKRESQSVLEMLNWLIHIAKHTDDPVTGKIPESSKWKDQGNEELWFQALLIREALLVKRQDDINKDESNQQGKQKKLKMHPSMYEEDNLDRQALEKVRCSKRASLTKSLLCSCCNAPTVNKSKVNSQKVGVRKSPKESLVVSIEIPTLDSQGPNSCGVPEEKQVSVGPLSQAGVPEWTGLSLKSDSKWLGTKMWPSEEGRNQSTAEMDPVMIGRQHICYCRFPYSVECVRFHITEKRLKLKRELGSLFYHWRFDRMGEEVSLSWTKEEEKRFKDANLNELWNNTSRFFPRRSREKLVSYYYNVFLVQRRSYQNRVTPNDINSDDDEKGCGLVGDSFGCRALMVPGWKFLTCTQNKESTDLA